MSPLLERAQLQISQRNIPKHMSVEHEIGITAALYQGRKGRQQCSSAICRSHQDFCLACLSSSQPLGAAQDPQIFPASSSLYILSAPPPLFSLLLSVIYLLLHASADKKKQGQIHLKAYFYETAFCSTAHPSPPNKVKEEGNNNVDRQILWKNVKQEVG